MSASTKMNRDCLGFDHSSRAFYDNCAKTFQESASAKAGQYSLYRSPNLEMERAQQLAYAQPNVHFKETVGYVGQHVDQESKLRNAANLTNLNTIQRQVNEPYIPTPNKSRGPGNPCVESMLLMGEDTGQRQPCNSFAREDLMEGRFATLVESVKDARRCQDALVHEDAKTGWKRGGESSRQLLKNPDFLKQIGYRHNGKYWQKK